MEYFMIISHENFGSFNYAKNEFYHKKIIFFYDVTYIRRDSLCYLNKRWHIRIGKCLGYRGHSTDLKILMIPMVTLLEIMLLNY